MFYETEWNPVAFFWIQWQTIIQFIVSAVQFWLYAGFILEAGKWKLSSDSYTVLAEWTNLPVCVLQQQHENTQWLTFPPTVSQARSLNCRKSGSAASFPSFPSVLLAAMQKLSWSFCWDVNCLKQRTAHTATVKFSVHSTTQLLFANSVTHLPSYL